MIAAMAGVTEQLCSGVVFSHFKEKFECSSSSHAPDKTAKQKEKNSFDAVIVANKEAAAYSEFLFLVFERYGFQPTYARPISRAFVGHFWSSSRFVKRKTTPIEESRTSQVLPDTDAIATTTGGAPHKANNWRQRKRGDADSFSESHMVEQCNNQNVRKRDSSNSIIFSNNLGDQIVIPRAAPQC
ncbi:hypothetical protein Tco_0543223 [Tanacetum coccineum]